MRPEKRCVLVRVRGRVQGVFFRHHSKQVAERLKLKGWVRNCPDGSVETLICGDTTQIEAMQSWLAHGPPLAEVLDICTEPYQGTDCYPSDFRICQS
ncbi:MAG: acylphosphatase [Mariprofundaceae bacterium]